MTRPTLMALFLLGCGHTKTAPSPSLTIGTPTVQHAGSDQALSAGSIDLEQVTEEVERRLGDLKQCYNRRLLVNPDLSGEVLIHWGISTSGEATHACITRDTVEDDELRSCVNKLALDGQYPPSQWQAVDVSIPFRFTPGGASPVR